MNFKITFYRNGGESEQPVASGQVPGVCWAWHTFNYSTGEHFVVDQARWQSAVPEPGPLAGEGELKQESEAQLLGELEAEHCRNKAEWDSDPALRQTPYGQMKLLTTYARLVAKRDKFAACAAGGTVEPDASPTSEAGSADRPHSVNEGDER